MLDLRKGFKMDFNSIIIYLKDGIRLSRKDWGYDEYIHLPNDKAFVVNELGSRYSFTPDDFFAEWEIHYSNPDFDNDSWGSWD